jgi:hypothetical protein
MNKLINTDSGGYPFVLDDLRFVDDSVREALKGGLSFLGDGFVLSANYNDITAATSWSFPETFAVLNGEILRIPAFTANSSPAVGKWYKLELDSTNSGTTPGLKTFQDASVHETYNLRKGILTLQTTPLVGGEVVILIGNTAKWEYYDVNTHKKRLADNIGLTTTTTTANSAQSDATDALNELIGIKEAWSVQNAGDLVGNVLRNSSAGGSASGNASMTFNSGSSYFRMKVIGKTVFIQYHIADIQVVAWNTAQVNSITLDLIAADILQSPTTIKPFNAIGRASSTVQGIPAAHLKISDHSTKPGALLFNLVDPNYSVLNLSFNRKATFDVSTLELTNTGDLTFTNNISLTGTLIIELS